MTLSLSGEGFCEAPRHFSVQRSNDVKNGGTPFHVLFFPSRSFSLLLPEWFVLTQGAEYEAEQGQRTWMHLNCTDGDEQR